MELTTVWFALIAVLWIGYFALEGFDFGVGMLLPVLAEGRHRASRPDQHHRPGLGRQRGVAARRRRRHLRRLPRVVRHAVQRLLPAAAAHPVALIVRGLAFEYRAKRDDDQWRRRWDLAIVVGSFVPALLWGVAFANILRGVPIDADMEYVGGFFNLLNPYALLGGATTLLLFLTHGAMFVASRPTAGSAQTPAALAVRVGARRRGRRGGVPGLDPGRDRHGGLRGRLRAGCRRAGGRPASPSARDGRAGRSSARSSPSPSVWPGCSSPCSRT